MPFQAYELRLADSGKLYWLERQSGEMRRYDYDPGTTWLQRMSVRFFSLLPIDWLL
jgi:putative cardiolipin synthase